MLLATASDEELGVVLGAVHALYGGTAGPEHQRQANAFLVDLAATEAAWRIGLRLLADPTLDCPMEARFFAANMLHAKAQREWARLAPSDQGPLAERLHALLEGVVRGDRPALAHGAIVRKLCGLYAIAMCAQPDACRALLASLLVEARTVPAARQLFLAFARCVCEELDDAELGFAAKDAMDAVVAGLSADVVEALGDILTTATAASSSSSSSMAEALPCLRVWLKKAGTSLTRLYATSPALLGVLLEGLSAGAHAGACAEILCQVFGVAEYPSAAEQEAALDATARALLALRAPYEHALATDDEELAHALTDVVATFCETYVDWIVEASTDDDDDDEATAPNADHVPVSRRPGAPGPALGELVLLLGMHPRRQIASLTLDFWLAVQEVPVVDRRAMFQREAFVALLDVLVAQCRFPADADAMDPLALDDLVAFRSGHQGVGDVLQAAFCLLHETFVARVLGPLALDTAADADAAALDDWRDLEVALFALASVADDLRKRLLLRLGPSSSSASSLAHLLSGLLTRVVARAPAQQHPLVVAAAATLVGHLGPWLRHTATAAGSVGPVAAALGFLGGALGLEDAEARGAAAKALMQVLTTCADVLVDAPPGAILGPTLAHVFAPTLTSDERLLVVEGLVRLAALSRHGPELIEGLLGPTLGGLDAAMRAGALPAIAEALRVCAKAMRFLDAPSPAAGGRGLTHEAFGRLWPVLEGGARLVALGAHDDDVPAALFELYGWCLQSLREELEPARLQVLATHIVGAFAQARAPAAPPLECACIVVDVFGRAAHAAAGSDDDDDGRRRLLRQTLRELIDALARECFARVAPDLEAHPDALQGLFDLVYRGLLYCPWAVLSAPAFGTLLELARAVLAAGQHRGATTAVATACAHLLGERHGRLGALLAGDPGLLARTVDAEAWGDPAHLGQWLEALVAALATRAPSVLLEALGRVLWGLWAGATDAEAPAVAALAGVVVDRATSSPTGHERLLSGPDGERVVALWAHFARTPTRMHERKFRSLCTDFARICRRELTVDVLMTYEDEERRRR